MQEPDPVPHPLDCLTSRGAAQAPALTVGGETLDYAGLEQAVGQLAAWLLGQGLKPGDRVASWLPKTLISALLPLATARAGLVHVPVNPLLKRAQTAYILADSDARLLIASEGRVATLEPEDVGAGCIVVEEEEARSFRAKSRNERSEPDRFSTSLETNGDYLRPSSQDPDTLAAILYTSGSTGKPKGVMLSHANLWLGAISVAYYLKLTPADRTLCVLPFAFDYGQNQLLSTWAAGGHAIPLDYLTPRDVVRAVERHDITTLAGVPPLWVQLTEADWPPETARRLKRLTNSGGALTEPLVRKLRATFPEADLYPMYGLTEAFRSTYLNPASVDAHPTAIGTAIPFAEVLVVRPDGALASPDEPGELVHSGPLVAQGYWRDPERTAARFRPAPAGSGYGGTAVWSGDKVVCGSDGLLRFVGRDDEMIKSAGNRISPTEIEEAAVASGAAAEAVAIGVPDARLGQAILLVVRGEEEAEAALRAYLKRELPNFMQPARIEWRAELPRSANGKLDRAKLKTELGA